MQHALQPYPRTKTFEASPNENFNPNQLRGGDSLHGSGPLSSVHGVGQAAVNDSFAS